MIDQYLQAFVTTREAPLVPGEVMVSQVMHTALRQVHGATLVLPQPSLVHGVTSALLRP